jgi:hypothetical protein
MPTMSTCCLDKWQFFCLFPETSGFGHRSEVCREEAGQQVPDLRDRGQQGFDFINLRFGRKVFGQMFIRDFGRN